ncbi:hypothetical protein PtA15_1A433 [Puccinia triticina]|uniref:Uncharacterized protein n=1 Tax=Puccinia triticina TaxID=208348 RepID=A0ABY7CB42_9BASI|nr:uncharacterized protein PtA15_1A433 [Puccinia triticina]WAQ81095.1 hypothetical protein PtA15_1A433 [Puccinia triticina]
MVRMEIWPSGLRRRLKVSPPVRVANPAVFGHGGQRPWWRPSNRRRPRRLYLPPQTLSLDSLALLLGLSGCSCSAQWLRLSSNPGILPCGLNPKPEIAWNLKPDSIALIPLTLGSVWVQAARQMGASRWKDPYKPAQSSTHIDNQQLLLLDFISKEEANYVSVKLVFLQQKNLKRFRFRLGSFSIVIRLVPINSVIL